MQEKAIFAAKAILGQIASLAFFFGYMRYIGAK